MNDLLQNLNEPQRQAVLNTEGPVLVLAGAGSGKTKALTHRIAYLIREKHISPYNILAVTFTNKAAAEIAARVQQLLGNSNFQNPISNQFPKSNDQKYKLPWAGTFHSVCVRILRREADYVGFSRSFTIYDENDKLSVIKRLQKDLGVDPKHYNPNSIGYFISGAKNELIDAKEYKKYTNSPFEQITAKIYERYEKYMHEVNALDFDDLIMQCVVLFQNNPQILEKYQNLFKYILIDEYQDTNQAQYIWAKLLASKHNNIMVVGDDYQCLVPNTDIYIDQETFLPIKALDKGNLVMAASGWGSICPDLVQKIHKTKYSGYLIRVKTKGGRILELTPNHKLFANLQSKPSLYSVYLMFRQDKGYRIGITQGVRSKKDQIVSGLMVRINQERGDRIWLLQSCKTLGDAMYLEQFYAFKYGIPTTIFEDSGKKAVYSQEKIDSLYQNIPTVERALKLALDIDLDLAFPHYQPQAVIKNGKGRKLVNLVMFGENRKFENRPWHAHRICLNTTDINLKDKLTGLYPIRNGQRGTWRVETSRKDYDQAVAYAEGLFSYDDELLLNQRARLLSDKSFNVLPAKNLRIGMVVPVLKGSNLDEDEIIAIEKFDYAGDLYDLDIANLHNYIANGMVVHNSIYSWRGANFRNILNFEKDYKNAVVIKLEQNYRSTKTILEAANDVIKFNENKTDKKLWTENDTGRAISVYEAMNEKDEAEFVAMEVKSSVESRRSKVGGNFTSNLKPQTSSYFDFAVLYRTNAQSRAVEEAFLRFKIPYKVVGGMRFYERKEIKDIISFLRLINNQMDLEALTRAVSCMPRGIGDKTIDKIREYISANFVISSGVLGAERSFDLPKISPTSSTRGRNDNLFLVLSRNDAFPSKVTDFFKLLYEFYKLYELSTPLDQLILKIAEKTGYRKYLQDGTPEGEGRWENVLELSTVAAQVEAQITNYQLPITTQIPSSNSQDLDIDHSLEIENYKIENSESGFENETTPLEKFLEQVSLVQDTDSLSGEAGVVTLMTLHSAKGLEFKTVFIVGVEEGLFPHSRALMDNSEMEEERRLAYVGITRAKELLYLLYATERNLYGRLQWNEKSRFIENIPEHLLDEI
ncbi:MAG: UvrD-helicase domain-containing protein [Patescibacteria group bacterium]